MWTPYKDVSDVFGNNMNIILLWKKMVIATWKRSRSKGLKHMYFADQQNLPPKKSVIYHKTLRIVVGDTEIADREIMR